MQADRMHRLMHRFLTRELKKFLKICAQRAIVADRESLEHVESIVDELEKSEGFDRPQIFIAEDISRFEPVACADSNCKISESAGDAVTDSENDILATVRRQMSMTDPLYIIYTSGSTGNPKES